MTLREIALTLHCRRCAAKPGQFCQTKPRFTKKGVKYYVMHKVRKNDASKAKKQKQRLDSWNSLYSTPVGDEGSN